MAGDYQGHDQAYWDKYNEDIIKKYGGVPSVDPAKSRTIPEQNRYQDIMKGKDFFEQYFGANNPEMKQIMDAYKAAATGNDPRTQLLREQGMEGINRNVQTSMRQFAGALPATGVRGGAAGAMAANLAQGALNQTRGLERDVAIDDLNRRDQALKGWESAVTGERGGLLGSMMGYAGLGVADRASSAQSSFGQDYLDYLTGKGKYAPPAYGTKKGDIVTDSSGYTTIVGEGSQHAPRRDPVTGKPRGHL